MLSNIVEIIVNIVRSTTLFSHDRPCCYGIVQPTMLLQLVLFLALYSAAESNWHDCIASLDYCSAFQIPGVIFHSIAVLELTKVDIRSVVKEYWSCYIIRMCCNLVIKPCVFTMSKITEIAERLVYIESILHGGAKIWILSSSDESNVLLIRYVSFVKYCFHHSKIKFISPSCRVDSMQKR